MTRVSGWVVPLIMVLLYVPLAQADYDAGQRALDTGKPVEALRLWQTATDTGDQRAMLALGRLYAQGLGTPRTTLKPTSGFNLAASRGEVSALQERDALAEKMTPRQVAASQERAAVWQPGGSRKPETVDAPSAAAGPPQRQAIREAQGLLAKLGYEPGPADGIWGKRSARAYRVFLRNAGRPESDTMTPEALSAMRQIVRRRSAAAVIAREEPSAPAVPRRQPEPSVPSPVQVRPDALHQAARAGDVENLKRALAAGVKVDRQGGRGWTALMHATDRGYPQLMGILLGAKADPDIRATDGMTALFIAVLHGRTEIIELLMEAGADITTRGPQGKTAVHVAWRRGNHEALKALGVTVPQPLCTGQTGSGCWQEVSGRPGCHVWNPFLQPESTITWSGGMRSR